MFLALCVVGYAVSFIGFGTFMNYVYPAIGYVGMLMIVVMLVWWVRERGAIQKETGRRFRILALLSLRLNPERRFGPKHQTILEEALEESVAEPAAVTGAIDQVVVEEILQGLAQTDGTSETGQTPPKGGPGSGTKPTR